MGQLRYALADEAAMVALGAALARCPLSGALLTLDGPLGSGKTTLVRALLRSLGEAGPVKSPTYSLLETYPDVLPQVHHLDLYRVVDPQELNTIGIESCFDADALVLVEWPGLGQGVLPEPDLQLHLDYAQVGREVVILANSVKGRSLVRQLKGEVD